MRSLRSQRLRLLAHALREFRDDECAQYAAAISFHVLFSLFPLAILLVSVLGLVLRDAGARDHVLRTVLDALPLSARGSADADRLLRSVTGGLTAIGLVSIPGLLWSASGVMAAIRSAVNAAWELDGGRPFLRGKLVDLLLVGSAGLLVLLSLGLTVAVRVVSELSRSAASALGPFAAGAGALAWLLGVLAPLALTFITFVFLYRVVPTTEVRLGDVWHAALLAAAVFEAAKNGFAVYLAHFGHYNAVYGSLGAVVAFLFFVYIGASVFLFGAELGSEVSRERRAARPGVTSPLSPSRG